VKRWLPGITAALLATSCGSTTTPTPPPPVEDPPKITCPAAQTVQLATGSSIAVTYTATATNGRAPVNVVCVPPSGSSFNVGLSTVTCTATDALQRTDLCSFAVTVVRPPTLAVTRFVAFGDSITAGEDGTAGGPPTGGLCQPGVTSAARLQPQVILPAAQTYPGQLQQKLGARYLTQSPSVLNRGCPGEAVTGANTLKRFDAVVGTRQQDVVLIMEGSNDLDIVAGASPSVQGGVIGSAAAGLRQMVNDARQVGLRPLLATIPPMNAAGSRGSGAGLVTMLNDRIRQIGPAENVPIVDVYAAFNGNLALLGADGLHPNAGGYTVIADAFFDTIKGTLEVSTPIVPSFAPMLRRR
jgi:lysophospholipase L1-like esterase